MNKSKQYISKEENVNILSIKNYNIQYTSTYVARTCPRLKPTLLQYNFPMFFNVYNSLQQSRIIFFTKKNPCLIIEITVNVE